MANGNGIELAQLAASAQDFLAPYQKAGRIRVASGSYVLAATLAAGGSAASDSINLCKIPKGGRVVLIVCVSGATHGAATPSIGDNLNPVKFRTAAVLTTVGASIQNTAAGQVGAAVEGVTIPYTAEATIILQNSTAAFPATGEYVHWFVFYVVD
jgi:hypothetical protein